MHARKSLLFCDGDLWAKKSRAEFDVTMESFDGAEVCKLVGLYLLHHLAKIFCKESVGLYRDDGLAILRNASAPDADRMRKKVTEFFQYHQLKVTVETNLIQKDFLNVTQILAQADTGHPVNQTTSPFALMCSPITHH